MNLLELVALNLALTGALLFLVWLISLWLADVSIVDAVWGLGFAAIAGATFILTGPPTDRKTILLALTAVWGVRLAAYLGWRKYGTPEDYRYRAMRESIGPRFWWVSLFVVFGLQGLIMNIVALPIVAGQLDDSPLGIWTAIGVVLWSIGLVFESVGDWQMARFKSDPANEGKVMDRGLWRYTRHPNYFGDFLVWWGLFFASLGEDPPWWTAIGPALMSYLLLRVSGVTMLERTLKTTKRGYAEYVARTSAFFPWPPRRPPLASGGG